MSKPILQLGNSANWLQVWTSAIVATRTPDGGFIPMPPLQCPVRLESRIITIYTYSARAKATWQIAGVLTRKIRAGVLVGGGYDVGVADLKLLRLNKNNLYIFDPLETDYEIEISPKYWLEDLEVAVFEYIGIDTDTVSEKLNQIELKIDGLS